MTPLDDGLPSPAGTRDIFDNLAALILERTSSVVPPWSEPDGWKLRTGLDLNGDEELFIAAVVLKDGYHVVAVGPRFEDRHRQWYAGSASIPVFAGVDGVPTLARVTRVYRSGSTAIAVVRWYDLTGPSYSTYSSIPLSDAEAVEVNFRFALIDEAAVQSWAHHASPPQPSPWRPSKVPPERREEIGALVLDLAKKNRSSAEIATSLSQEGIDVNPSTVRSWLPTLRALRDHEQRRVTNKA